MLQCPHCQATKSRSGRPFTAESLAQHIRDAHAPTRVFRPQLSNTAALAVADMLAGDEPDGAYWAIAGELGFRFR